MNFVNRFLNKPEALDTLFSLLSQGIAVMPTKAMDDGGILPLVRPSEITSKEQLLRRVSDNYDSLYDGVDFICGELNDFTYFVDVDFHLDIPENSERLNNFLSYVTENKITSWEDLPYYRVGTKGLAFPFKVSDNTKIIRGANVDGLEIKISGFCAVPPGIHRKSSQVYKSLGKTKSLITHIKNNEVVVFNTDNLLSFLKQNMANNYQSNRVKSGGNVDKDIQGRNNHIYYQIVDYKRSLKRSAPTQLEIQDRIQGILDTIDFEDYEAEEFSLGHWMQRFNSIKIFDVEEDENMGVLIPLKKKQLEVLENLPDIPRSKRFSPLLQAYSEKDHKLMHAFPNGLNFKNDFEAIACFEYLIQDITGAKPKVWNGRIHVWNGAYWEMLTMDRLKKAFNSLLPCWEATKSLSKIKEPTAHLISSITNSQKMFQELPHSITSGGVQYLACRKTKKLIIQKPSSDIFTRFKMDYNLDYLGEVSFNKYFEKFKIECPNLFKFLDYAWNTPQTQKYNDFENVIKCFQEVVAAVLFGFGPRLQKAVLFMGIAHSGKSTLISIISGLIPRGFVSTTSPVDWGDEYALGNMMDKMVNIVTDLDVEKRIPGGKFKTVVSGEPIRVNIKYETPVDHAQITAMNLIASNEPPITKDSTGGFRRRFQCFHNGRRLVHRDADFATKVIQEEGVGLFNFALGAVNRLLETTEFTQTRMNLDICRAMGVKNDNIFEFLLDCKENKIPGVSFTGSQKDILPLELFLRIYNSYKMRNDGKGLRLEEFNQKIDDKLNGDEPFFDGLGFDVVSKNVTGLTHNEDFKKELSKIGT